MVQNDLFNNELYKIIYDENYVPVGSIEPSGEATYWISREHDERGMRLVSVHEPSDSSKHLWIKTREIKDDSQTSK